MADETPAPADFSALVTDIHSHFIPGIDDGSPNVEASIAMLRGMHKLGFRHFITTPHVMSDSYPNTPEKIFTGLEEVRAAIRREGLPVTIDAAAEYYVDEMFEEWVDAGEQLLTFGGSKRYLLIETSYMNKPLSLEPVIFKLNTQGYSPVLAHPERYTYFWGDKDLEQLTHMYELGLRFQVNTGSLAGSYSKRAGMIARQLIEADMVDFLGSDLHQEKQMDALRRALSSGPEIAMLLESGRLLNHRLAPVT